MVRLCPGIGRGPMAVYVEERGADVARVVCDACGWTSAPVAPERAAAWALEHHRSCQVNALAERSGTP